jgi:hypothetical protein
MPKSNRAGGFGQRGGTVTVIEQPVMRSYRRKAKVIFWITLVAVTLLSAVVLASWWQPVLALIAGLLIGLVLAAIAFSLVATWPVIRVIWWWLPELSLAAGLVAGWDELGRLSLVIRLIGVTAVVGVPAAVAPARRYLGRVVMCQVSRHRVRTCFSEFIVTNRTGSLPLILGARPTPAGERLWVFLRPGLSLADIQQRADKIASGCWADTVIADRASASNSALVRLDIKRRDTLNRTLASPLKAAFGGLIPARKPVIAPPPADLDLTDVTAADVIAAPKNGAVVNGVTDRPKWPNIPARRDPEPVSNESDDVSDWI